jgi:hypothetical protein
MALIHRHRLGAAENRQGLVKHCCSCHKNSESYQKTFQSKSGATLT